MGENLVETVVFYFAWIAVIGGPIGITRDWSKKYRRVHMRAPHQTDTVVRLALTDLLLTSVTILLFVFAARLGPHRTLMDAIFLIIRDDWTLAIWVSILVRIFIDLMIDFRMSDRLDEFPGYFEEDPDKTKVRIVALQQLGSNILYLVLIWFLLDADFYAAMPLEIMRTPAELI